jgi:hypothetical protein
MIPSPDFRLDISITIAEEVLRVGCYTIGFALAVWAVVKMTQILFGEPTTKSTLETSKQDIK